MSSDWEQQINPEPYDAGRFQAERLCALPMPVLIRALERAWQDRAELGSKPFRRAERTHLDGFISRLVEEIRRRAGDEMTWEAIVSGQYSGPGAGAGPNSDPEADVEPAPAGGGVLPVDELALIERFVVPEESGPPREVPTPVGPLHENPTPIPDYLLQAWKEPRRELTRPFPNPQLGTAGPAVPDHLFERWIEDSKEMNRPRAVPPPGEEAAPALPDFLLEPWEETAKARLAPGTRPAVSLPVLPDLLLQLWDETPRPRPAPDLNPEEPSPGSGFILHIEEEPQPEGLFVFLRGVLSFVRGLFDKPSPRYEQWEE
jgi:hypothetical protein